MRGRWKKEILLFVIGAVWGFMGIHILGQYGVES